MSVIRVPKATEDGHRLIQVRVPSLPGFFAAYWNNGASDPQIGETIELKDESGNRKSGAVTTRHWIIDEDKRATLHIEIKENLT